MRLLTILVTITLILAFGCTTSEVDLPPISELYPSNGTILSEEDNLLSWEAGPESETYHIQVSETADFSGDLILDEETKINELELPKLSADSVYSWRIRYKLDKGGWGSWNGPWQFGNYRGLSRLGINLFG